MSRIASNRLGDQLLVYARDFGEEHRRLREAQRSLEERDTRIRELAAAYVIAQEEERRRVAYEIHDRLAQDLLATLHQLHGLGRILSENPAARQHVDCMSALVQGAIQQTRDIANNLHPPFIHELGLCAVMADELDRFRKATGCITRFKTHFRLRAPREAEVALYRIAQEALTNIKRHALGARHVVVDVSYRASLTTLQVSDDGCGFDVATAMNQARVGGLKSMEFRAVSLGGTFQVTRARGGGTVVTACIPTRDEARH